MKLMSLFDGSGGFPLAASLCGIEPVYAAEVEPYPIAVTENRFPKMKHLGDVSKVKGGEIEPVDIITFGSPCHTISTDSRNYIVHCLQGNGIDRADTAGCNGKGVCEDKCYTLNTIDRHAVCFAQQAYNKFIQEDIAATLKASGGTYGGGSENLVAEQSFSPIRYIVRRLTPTECAKLQGFPDWWGEIPKKDNLTDDEYVFWLNARNTYAKINNKTTKEYSKEQMLSWYNKLHNDSSEYKMWGNGIALPNALYVMQGIAEVVGVHHSK
jgi:site-specific DNA-cytosine methylase